MCREAKAYFSRRYLADLVQRILPVSIRVFKVVVRRERAVDVSSNNGFLSRVLQHTQSQTHQMWAKEHFVEQSQEADSSLLSRGFWNFAGLSFSFINSFRCSHWTHRLFFLFNTFIDLKDKKILGFCLRTQQWRHTTDQTGTTAADTQTHTHTGYAETLPSSPFFMHKHNEARICKKNKWPPTGTFAWLVHDRRNFRFALFVLCAKEIDRYIRIYQKDAYRGTRFAITITITRGLQAPRG